MQSGNVLELNIRDRFLILSLALFIKCEIMTISSCNITLIISKVYGYYFPLTNGCALLYTGEGNDYCVHHNSLLIMKK